MSNFLQMSFSEQRDVVRKVFSFLVDRGVLSNKGKRNATVIRAAIEKKFGITITTNREAWQAFVEDSIPASVENAETRNARKAAEAAAIMADLSL